MRYLSRLGSLKPSSTDNLFYLPIRKSQSCLLSSRSKLSKLHPSKNDHNKSQTESEDQSVGSLFNEIAEILGAETVTVGRNPAGFSAFKGTQLSVGEITAEYRSCTQGVCGIAEDNAREMVDLSVLEDTQTSHSGGNDVSPMVDEITKIVRADIGTGSMEEKLEKSGFVFDSEVVEKVLKRCFKVPHLALRFFNWVKFRNGGCHTTRTYNTMLYIAGEAKEFGLVEKLIGEMEEKGCERDIKTWTILISHYGKAKLIGKALLILEKMWKSGCEPDVAAYMILIRSLCNAQKADIALEFYKEMVQKEMGLDMSLYELLLTCLAGSGDIAGVQLVADDMIRRSQIPERDVFSCMLKSFCIAGRIREALELIRDLNDKNLTLEPNDFETLVKGLCRADRITDAAEIVDIMKKRKVVDAKVYGIIVSGYLRRNDIPKAFDVLQTMTESGYLPTISTYTELMQHLFRLNEYQKGCKLYDEMLERGVEPDSVAITAMVAGHVRQNHIFEAWKVFNSMQERGIRATWKSYSVFIKELCKISRTDEVIKVLNEMQASKIIIGDEVFNWVISYLEKKGETEMVKKVMQMQRTCKFYPQEHEASGSIVPKRQLHNLDFNFNQLESGRMDLHLVEHLPKTYNEQDLQEICRILSTSMDWCLIEEALEKCTVQFTSQLVVEILRSCSLHGHAALLFFSWVGKRDGYSHTTETYNMGIKISGCSKNFRSMRNLLFEMRRKGHPVTPDTWTIMIMQYGRAGLTEIALRNFAEMKANDCKPNGSTYKYLIICLCGRKGRKVDEAIKTFLEMIRAGYVPDKELVESYLKCLCEVGKLLDARRCTEALCKLGFTIPLSYSLYIRALCRAGRLEEALALVDEVGPERVTLDQYIYGSLVHGLLRRGRLKEALEKVDSMKQIGIHPTVHVYTSLIVHFFKEKQMRKALETFQKMKEEGCEPTIVTYSALIRGHMDMGNFVDAWNVFGLLQLKGPFPDFKTYSMFISCLCKVGKSEEALQLLSEMLDSGIIPSTINFRTVMFGLNREGKHSLANIVLQKKLALKSKRKL